MSSWKSSSSKGILDPDAMLELEDQLDYEPDGAEYDIESDPDDDLIAGADDYVTEIPRYSPEEGSEDEVENTNGLQEQDCRVQLPQPNGQDQGSSDLTYSSQRQSLDYGTDLEKTPSVTPSYRSKINYNALHIDVEKDSCRSRFGRYSTVSESRHLDSSDEEVEYDDTSNGLIGVLDTKAGETTLYSGANFENDDEDDIGIRVDSQEGGEPFSYDYSTGSENSQTYENMVSPQDVWDESPQSGASTVQVDNANNSTNFGAAIKKNIPPDYNGLRKNNSVNDISAVPVPKKRTGLNFSIKVVGSERICLLPTKKVQKKSHKAWVGTVGQYMDNSDIVNLNSHDDLIEYLSDSQTSSVKNRLGERSSHGSQTSESEASSPSPFKVPLKRPPTRLKATSGKNFCVSVDLKSKLRIVGDDYNGNHQDDKTDKDDAISLMASCQLSTTDEVDEARDLHNNVFIKDEPLSLPGSSHGTEEAKIARTLQWVSKAAEPSKTAVPAIYRGLCYKYFLNSYCNNKMCKLSHLLVTPQTRLKELPFASIEVIKEAYQFAKEHPFLYGQIYKHFADVFALKDWKNELIDMANIIFEESFHKIDHEEGLSTVLNALQKTNLATFEDTVEYLLLQIGLKRYPTLGNVLLEIICKKPDLTHHWPIIRRLIIAGEKMSYRLGTKFLIHLMKSPVNIKVCQEVHRKIENHKCIDLDQMPDAIKEPFLKIVRQENGERGTAELEANIERNLRKERFNFERAIQNNSAPATETVLPDFSVPPPNIGLGRALVPPSFNFIRPTEFGSVSGSQQTDFASLSRQEAVFPSEPNPFSCPPPAFDAPPRTYTSEDVRSQSSGSHHDVDLRTRPQRMGRPIYNNGSSEDDRSPTSAVHSDSDSSVEKSASYFHPTLLNHASRKRTAPTGLTYNREGLQYDPANDYVPPPKKQPNLRVNFSPQTEFGRLNVNSPTFVSDFVPPPKKRTPEPQNEFDRLKDARPPFSGIYDVPPPKNRASTTNPQTTEFDRLRESSFTFQRSHREDRSAEPTFQRPHHEDRSAEPTFQKPHHEDRSAAPTFQRPHHEDRSAEPTFQRPHHEDRSAEPTFQRPHHEDRSAEPTFPRPRHEDRSAEPTFQRPHHEDRSAEPTFQRPHHEDRSAEPTFPRPRHEDRSPEPTFQRPHHEDRSAEPTFQRPHHEDRSAEPTFQRPHHEDRSAEPTFHRPIRIEQRAGATIRNVRTNNSRADGLLRRAEFSNETAVLSRSNAKFRDEKICPPEVPQFGKLDFDPKYEFNVSLHNLYLQAIDNVDIDEDDVHRLNDCVKTSDGKIFLTLVEKYKGPKTVQNFISMTLAHLKGMNQMVARTYQRLLDTIEKENPWFYGNVYIRVILEVITMNLLFELFQRNMMEAANNFLNKFSNWDSLVTSRLFINSGSKGVSIIGRYLFIAKILNNSKPELTYEILVNPNLHLLEQYDKWPYHPPCPIPEIFTADLELRNNLIINFLKSAYQLNTVVVIQLYKTAFRKNICQFADIKRYINPMVVDLINKGGHTVSLKQVHNEISMFYKHMAKDTLRAFLISLYKHLGETDLFLLYEKCVERKVYHQLVTGDKMEWNVELKTDMLSCEIELIIKYYFHKLSQIKKVPSGSESLKFDIKLPGERSSRVLPILNRNRSIVKTNETVTVLLKKLYLIESTSLSPSTVEVQKEELVNYLDRLWT